MSVKGFDMMKVPVQGICGGVPHCSLCKEATNVSYRPPRGGKCRCVCGPPFGGVGREGYTCVIVGDSLRGGVKRVGLMGLV